MHGGPSPQGRPRAVKAEVSTGERRLYTTRCPHEVRSLCLVRNTLINSFWFLLTPSQFKSVVGSVALLGLRGRPAPSGVCSQSSEAPVQLGPTRVGVGQGPLPFSQEGTEKNRNLPTHNRLAVTELGKSHWWQTAGYSHNLKTHSPRSQTKSTGALKVKSGRHRVDRQAPVLCGDTGLGLLEWPLLASGFSAVVWDRGAVRSLQGQ